MCKGVGEHGPDTVLDTPVLYVNGSLCDAGMPVIARPAGIQTTPCLVTERLYEQRLSATASTALAPRRSSAEGTPYYLHTSASRPAGVRSLASILQAPIDAAHDIFGADSTGSIMAIMAPRRPDRIINLGVVVAPCSSIDSHEVRYAVFLGDSTAPIAVGCSSFPSRGGCIEGREGGDWEDRRPCLSG